MHCRCHGLQVRPEEGVTQYVQDRTQGPACSIACGPATVIRNYFIPVPGGPGAPPQEGQTADRMLNNLADFCHASGNADGRYFKVVGGYSMINSCPSPLSEYNEKLKGLSEDALLQTIRVGVHRDVEVGRTPTLLPHLPARSPSLRVYEAPVHRRMRGVDRWRSCSCTANTEGRGPWQVTSHSWGKRLPGKGHTVTQVFASATAVG